MADDLLAAMNAYAKAAAVLLVMKNERSLRDVPDRPLMPGEKLAYPDENGEGRPLTMAVIQEWSDELQVELGKVFVDADVTGMAVLYDRIKAERHLLMRLADFGAEFAPIRPDLLESKRVPPHATIHLSVDGVGFSHPALYLMHDVAVLYNDAAGAAQRTAAALEPFLSDEDLIAAVAEREGTDNPSLVAACVHEEARKRASENEEVRRQIQADSERSQTSFRMCVVTAFTLVEAYLNGIIWDHLLTNSLDSAGLLALKDAGILSKPDLKVMDPQQWERFEEKVTRAPKIVAGLDRNTTLPFEQPGGSFERFNRAVKDRRDAVIHAAPARMTETGGDYDKFDVFYGFRLATVREAVDAAVDLVADLHRVATGQTGDPDWLLRRSGTGDLDEFVIPPLYHPLAPGPSTEPD